MSEPSAPEPSSAPGSEAVGAGRASAPAGPLGKVWAASFNRTLDQIWDFVTERTGIRKWALRPQPEFSFRPAYWTGAFVASAFMVQVVTGLLLLVYYVPSAASTTTNGPPAAWSSTAYTIQNVPMGQLMLTGHLYGAYATIFLAFIHFFRGLYAGAYKRPREVSWMVGTFLLVAMLGMGFTGYLLPYTALSVGATDVGLVLAGSVPVVGPLLVGVLQGDGTYQGLLSRMFALHVVIIPVMLAFLLYAHISLFEVHGIAPRPSSDPKAKRTLTEKDDRRMTPWFPRVFLYMSKWAFVYVGLLLLLVAAWPVQLSAAFGSQNQGGVSPEPDWYFLWMYKIADFQYVSPLVAVGLVTALLVFLLLLPWVETVIGFVLRSKKNPRTHPRDRPFVLFLANFLLCFFALLTVWGGVMPGVVIPASMYVAYLGPLALLNGTVIFYRYRRYRANYAVRLTNREDLPTSSPSTARPKLLAFPRASLLAAPRTTKAFWDLRTSASTMVAAGLLVPLGYLLTLPSWTGQTYERGVALALALLALGVAALFHVTELTYTPVIARGRAGRQERGPSGH